MWTQKFPCRKTCPLWIGDAPSAREDKNLCYMEMATMASSNDDMNGYLEWIAKTYGTQGSGSRRGRLWMPFDLAMFLEAICWKTQVIDDGFASTHQIKWSCSGGKMEAHCPMEGMLILQSAWLRCCEQKSRSVTKFTSSGSDIHVSMPWLPFSISRALGPCPIRGKATFNMPWIIPSFRHLQVVKNYKLWRYTARWFPATLGAGRGDDDIGGEGLPPRESDDGPPKAVVPAALSYPCPIL